MNIIHIYFIMNIIHIFFLSRGGGDCNAKPPKLLAMSFTSRVLTGGKVEQRIWLISSLLKYVQFHKIFL